MRGPPAWSAAFALMLVLAGCVKPDASPEPEPEPATEPVAPAAAPAPSNGSLEVLAVFADRTPLSGVDITIGDLRRSTDATGIARFEEIPAGTHTLVATKTAHRTAQQEITIHAGERASVEVVLAAEDGGQHSHEVGFDAHTDTYVFEGHFDCSATYVIITGDCLIVVSNVTSTAGVPDPTASATTERNVIDFPLDLSWATLTVEMAWQEPSPPTTDGMTLALEPAEAPADGHAAKYARVNGGSPLRIDLYPGEKHATATEQDMPKPEGGEVIRARAFLRGHAHNPAGTDFLGVGAAREFPFTMTVTITYE